MGRAEQTCQLRRDTLLGELEHGIQDFTGPVPAYLSDPLIHACYVTVEATMRTSRREKIRWFARLLLAGVGERPRLDLANEHEDFLKILDDLSYRELGILATLAKFEQTYPMAEGETSALQRGNRFWEEFEREACASFTIPQAEFSGLLARLNRTGTYETFTGAVYGYSGGRGNLTPLYYRLASIISLDRDEFDSGQVV